MVQEQEKFIKSRYKLKQSALDAFSDKVARPDHLIWWTNREQELSAWNEIMSKALVTKKNYLSFIIGSYGRGKTLSLLKIVDESKKYPKILSSFLNLKGEEKSVPGLDLMFKIFRSINFYEIVKNIKPSILREMIDGMPDEINEVKHVLLTIYFGNTEAYQASMFTNLNKLAENRISEIALRFIQGYITPTNIQMKEIGIVRKLDEVDIAKEYLLGILIFTKKLGYDSCLVAIDEFEALFSLVTKSQQSIYISLLRSLYDYPLGVQGDKLSKVDLSNMVLFMGISESGWSSLSEMKDKEEAVGGPTVPFLERVDNKTVLSTFTTSQTLELIEKRLKYNRIDGVIKDEPLIPFTDDFVKYVHEITNGEPRYILVRCGHVLDAGIAERVPKLDRKFAQRVLEERGY